MKKRRVDGMPLAKAKRIAHTPLARFDENQIRKAQLAHQTVFRHENKTLDYSKSKLFENVALYTPAISDGYINNVTRLIQKRNQAETIGNPTLDPLNGYDFEAEDLQFINPNSSLFFYPWVLFSGGQGAKNPGAALKNNWVTRRPRDPRVVLLGDSGGFQIQQQTIDFDPIETPGRMLKWLERVADQSMILDFPTGGISSGAMVPHMLRLQQDGHDIEGMAKSSGVYTG